MGIYTDYGRFVKARQFKNWCNSGAGIWFGFGIGSPEWDEIVTDSDGKGRPNVPPSSPNLYSPLYRWFTSYKEDHGAEQPIILAEQELSLLDLSYWGKEDGQYPDYNTVKQNPSLPPDTFTPDLAFFEPNYLNGSNYEFQDRLYGYKTLSNSVPVFPQMYDDDWGDIADNYPSGFDPNVEPTDPAQYESFAYNYHLYYSGTNFNSHVFGAPVGLLAFIQGSAHFVEPIDGDPTSTSGIENLRKFKYGNHYWRIVQDTTLEDFEDNGKLPHHILLTVSVFPNELAYSSLVEMQLPVRQVSVFKFPDNLVTPLGLDANPLPRSSQVIRRDSINMVYAKKEDSVITKTEENQNRKNIPFNFFTPLDPNNQDAPTIEMIINDFMTARKRDVQQTDRYGYIIGF